jgi:formate/nitrite transporter FocA (FNT family)
MEGSMDDRGNLYTKIKESHNFSEGVTSRMIERKIEDEIFTPVIVKREDSICVHPGDVLERAIKDGYKLHQRKKISLFLSSLSAGFFLGFSVLCISIIMQIELVYTNPVIGRLLMATFYPLGFILCIMSGHALFTEQTALAFYPYLAKKINFTKLFSLWGVTIFGNIVGAYIIAVLLKLSEPIIGIEYELVKLSLKMVSFDGVTIFLQ